MTDIFKASGYLPPTVTDDGKTVIFGVIDEAGKRLGITLPSPVNAQLIADLQNADAKARDLFLGVPRIGNGGGVRRAIRQPNTASIQQDAMTGALLLVIDDGQPTEMAFQMSPDSAKSLGELFLESSKQAEQPLTKQ